MRDLYWGVRSARLGRFRVAILERRYEPHALWTTKLASWYAFTLKFCCMQRTNYEGEMQ